MIQYVCSYHFYLLLYYREVVASSGLSIGYGKAEILGQM